MEVNDQEITTVALFYGIWSAVNPNGKVSLLVRREGRMKTVRISLK